MAQQTNPKMISGTIGNVIFQEQYGKQIIRVHPGKIKQTAATKSSAGEFGSCSRWAKALRVGLQPFLTDWTDNAFYRRLTAALYNAICANTNIPKGQRNLFNTNLEFLAGLDCNIHTPWSKWFLATLTVELTPEKQLRITVPELVTATQLIYPEECVKAELVLYVMASILEPGNPITAHHTTIPLPYANTTLPATDWLTPALPENTIVVAAAQLLFYDDNTITGRHYHNNAMLNPAVILQVEPVV